MLGSANLAKKLSIEIIGLRGEPTTNILIRQNNFQLSFKYAALYPQIHSVLSLLIKEACFSCRETPLKISTNWLKYRGYKLAGPAPNGTCIITPIPKAQGTSQNGSGGDRQNPRTEMIISNSFFWTGWRFCFHELSTAWLSTKDLQRPPQSIGHNRGKFPKALPVYEELQTSHWSAGGGGISFSFTVLLLPPSSVLLSWVRQQS